MKEFFANIPKNMEKAGILLGGRLTLGTDLLPLTRVERLVGMEVLIEPKDAMIR